ncbi:MAG: hypothetical protein IM638_09885 [Bacteroidetes bacterium]|nr:hypothetical protein [Bacteroidota bacterium]
MKRIYFILVLLLAVVCTGLNAQTLGDETEEYRSPLMDKLVVGGNVGLQFGNLTYIDASPMVGYKLFERVHAGVGGTYRYYRQRVPQSSSILRANIIGGSIWARGYIFGNLFVHGEYEGLRFEAIGGTRRRAILLNYALVGGGYTQQFGPRLSAMATFLFPVYSRSTIPNYTIYVNTVIRVGVMFEFGGINR